MEIAERKIKPFTAGHAEVQAPRTLPAPNSDNIVKTTTLK